MTSTLSSAINRKQRPSAGKVVVGIILIGYATISLTPLLIMFLNSFRKTSDLLKNPLGMEWPISFDAYAVAWNSANFSSYFMNSIVVTVGSVLLSTAVAVPAAYAISRVRTKAMSVTEVVFLSGLMLPVHLAVLPTFYLLDSMGLVDTLLGLIFVYAASSIPFSIFVLTAFFRQLPEELEEAAQLDGAGPFQRFFLVMMPLVKPAIATVIVFRFVPVWNDFLYPLVLLRSSDNFTLPVGLSMFFGEYSTNWSALFAGLVIATVPLIILFLVATKQIIAGLTAGMSK
jgi:raffinose/stachyose/melibiose transport system permease protein